MDGCVDGEKIGFDRKISCKNTLFGEWVDGWVDGRESQVKDCLQQSKSGKKSQYNCKIRS